MTEAANKVKKEEGEGEMERKESLNGGNGRRGEAEPQPEDRNRKLSALSPRSVPISPSPTTTTSTSSTSPSNRVNRLKGNSYLVGLGGLLVLVYVNVQLFQPYLTSIVFAWAVSLPLRQVKDAISSFLKKGLKNREESETWDFVKFSSLRVFLHVFFGETLSKWFFSFTSPFLFPDLKFVDTEPELKLRPLDELSKSDQGTSTDNKSNPQKSSVSSPKEKMEKDVFRDLNDPVVPSKPVNKPTLIEKTSLDSMIQYLQRSDWYYMVLLIRSCVAFGVLKFLLHNKTKVVLVTALLGGGRILSTNFQGSFPSIRSKVKSALSLFCNVNTRFKSTMSRWVHSDIEGSVATFLLLSIVSGIVFGSYALYTSVVGEIRGGLRHYLFALVKRTINEVLGLINAIAFDSQYAPPYVATVQGYADGILKDQLQVNSTSAELAKFATGPEFASWMNDRAPVTWGLMSGSIEKGLKKLTHPTFFTPVAKELYDLVQSEFLVTQAPPSIDLSSYAAIAAVPILGFFSSFTASLVQSILVPGLVLFLDSIFQVMVFAIVLFGLLSQKESPLEPARRLLCKLWGKNRTDLEYRLATRVEDQISGICLFTVQMGLFHTLFSWLTLHLAKAPGPCIFGLLSGMIAVIPVGGPYIAALPPVLVMYYGEGRRMAAILLFLSHLVTAMMVDTHFYAHLPTVSSFFVALAAFLGHALLGLQGLLVGPLLLSMIPVLYSEFLVDTATPLP